MNPDSNKFESLIQKFAESSTLDNFKEKVLVRPNGEPIPGHWSVFQIDEEVILKNYRFKVGYINENTLILEPLGIWEPPKDE